MKQVGLEKHLAIIELPSTSRALVESLGPTASAELASKPGDNTHFNAEGAAAMARLVMQELATPDPALATYLHRDE